MSVALHEGLSIHLVDALPCCLFQHVWLERADQTFVWNSLCLPQNLDATKHCKARGNISRIHGHSTLFRKYAAGHMDFKVSGIRDKYRNGDHGGRCAGCVCAVCSPCAAAPFGMVHAGRFSLSFQLFVFQFWVAALGGGGSMTGAVYQRCARGCGLVCDQTNLKDHEGRCTGEERLENCLRLPYVSVIDGIKQMQRKLRQQTCLRILRTLVVSWNWYTFWV